MPAPNAIPTPITPPRVPFFDERSGLISREWYMFFLSLFRQATGAYDALTAPLSVDQSGEISQVAQFTQLASQIASSAQDTAQDAQLAAQLSSLQAETAALQTAVQGLALAPPPRQFKRSRYGQFYDTTTQTAGAINTAYAITFNTVSLSSGVRLRSPSTSEVEVDTEGVYNIQFSAQLDNTSGGNHLAYIWLRLNGADVAYSAGRLVLKGTDGDLVAGWNYFAQLKAGDYFQLMWSVVDVAVQLVAVAAAAPVPAIPSIILTVNNGIEGVQ